MSHYQPYPAYKDSGVEWLGAVPEHWDVFRMKSVIFLAQNGFWGEESTGGSDDVLCARVADFNRINLTVGGNLPTVRSVPAAQRESRQVNNSDLLFEKSGGGEQTSVGVVVQYVGEAPVICSNFVAVVKCKTGISSRWLCYTNAHLYSVGVNRRSIKQTTGIQNIDSEEYFSEAIAVPTKDEQRSIAAHLDREAARIDGLVSKKTRFIELLREKRQALITHAVTKGLDPNVKIKDSGVEWLGEVPEHWKVLPLKWELAFLTSGSRGWAEHYADDGALFIRIGNLTRDSTKLDLSDIQRVAVPEGTEGERTKVQQDDMLFSITAYLGSVAIVPAELEPAYISQHVALARLVGRSLHPSWAGYVALSWVGKTYLEAQGYGGTKIQLGLDDIANLIMTAPPLEEQFEITGFLDSETTRIDTLISKTERSIELLKERRSALITAAVTGQIDLREVA